MYKKIILFLLSFCALNLTAANYSTNTHLVNRLYELSETFKNMVAGCFQNPMQEDKLEAFLKLFPKVSKKEEEEAEEEGDTYVTYENARGLLEIVRHAQNNTPEALEAATKQYLTGLDDLNKYGKEAIALLKSADYLHIEPIIQVATRCVVNYLKTPQAWQMFNNNPEYFVEHDINLPLQLEELVSAELLRAFKVQLTEFGDPKAFEDTGLINSVAYSRPDGTELASASEDHTIKLWNLQTGALLRILRGHTEPVTAVAYSPDGKQLASASWDRTIRLWNPQTGAPLNILNGHTGWVFAVAYSPDGKQLASASWDRTIRLWNPQTGEFLDTLNGHTNAVNSVAYSPDGKQLASASWDNTIKLWNPHTRALLDTLNGHTKWVLAIAYSPDGKQLASASWDNTIRLWNPQTGVFLDTLNGHTNAVNSVAYSPDGKQLASTSQDNTIKLWDPQTGAFLDTLNGGNTNAINSVTYSPDGKQLASASGNSIKLWNIPDFDKSINDINFAQALYIYYRLQRALEPENQYAQDYFQALYHTLPEAIRHKLGG